MLICQFRKSTSKYTSEFDHKYINFESLLQVYFWVRKEIQMHFKNRFKVYLKYASLLNSWCTESILETCISKLFFHYFHDVTNFGSQNISKSILEVYFIFRAQKYIWSRYSSISLGQNTNISLHNLWSNDLVVRV